jgi:dTDP-4-amino-4,6-dideoxy-D-galactose acyltransferase
VSLIERLEWDSSFFGLPIGRVRQGVGADRLANVVNEAESHGLRCVYLLASADQSELVVAAEGHGFRVREIRMELQRTVEGHPAALTGLRSAQADELDALAPIARERIRGTRFFADNHFAQKTSAELYVEWLRRGLVDPERQTLVADDDQGFVVCHLDGVSGTGTIELIAVADGAARGGVGKSLMAGAGAIFNASSMVTARVVTQGANIAAQSLYQACGYRTTRVFYWLHMWLPGR